MLPKGSQVWTSSRRQGRQQIGKRSTQAQRSMIMFHVEPGVDCAQRPVQRASATSAGDAPFSHSPVHRVPPREPGEDQKRSDAAGLPSVALTRARGYYKATQKRWRQKGRTRISSHRRHGAMPTARSTHGLLGYTPPPTTKFQLLPLVHVKLASGRSLARFLRIRASAS